MLEQNQIQKRLGTPKQIWGISEAGEVSETVLFSFILTTLMAPDP